MWTIFVIIIRSPITIIWLISITFLFLPLALFLTTAVTLLKIIGLPFAFIGALFKNDRNWFNSYFTPDGWSIKDGLLEVVKAYKYTLSWGSGVN